jgi:hypothetical protein
VFLFAPNLVNCSQPNDTNSAIPGGQNVYGFVYATVTLEDYAKHQYCDGPIGQIAGDDLNLQSPEPITPPRFATFAVSHEFDEAVTSPGSPPAGWLVPGGPGSADQLADPCADRTLVGNSTGYDFSMGKHWPYFNFTRDSYGTVVAAFVKYSPNSSSGTCYPTVSTGVPPG